MEGMTVGKLLVIGIMVIVALVMWQASGQNLGGTCPVG